MLGELEEIAFPAATRAVKEKSFGVIWTPLSWLDDRGFVKSVSRVVLGSRLSKQQKLFVVTRRGQEALAHSHEQTKSLLVGSGIEGGVVIG